MEHGWNTDGTRMEHGFLPVSATDINEQINGARWNASLPGEGLTGDAVGANSASPLE